MFETRAIASCLAATILCFAARPAEAVKYMSIEQAVKTFIPEDAKIFKVNKALNATQKTKLIDDYGWEATDPSYTFYVGKKGEQVVSYIFVVPEIFNTCFHKYAVGMNPDGAIKETVIVELTCPRAFPVNTRAFLSQLDGKDHEHALTVTHDVDAVTGATLSSEATARAARKAVSLHAIFFGGGAGAQIAESVKKARKSGSQMIQDAIDTGETLGDGAAQLPEDYKAKKKEDPK